MEMRYCFIFSGFCFRQIFVSFYSFNEGETGENGDQNIPHSLSLLKIRCLNVDKKISITEEVNYIECRKMRDRHVKNNEKLVLTTSILNFNYILY